MKPNFLSLASDPNFRALFEEGRLADHIASLERRILSTSTPLEETLVLRAELAGIRKVWDAVAGEAGVEQKALLSRQTPPERPRTAAMLPRSLP